MSETPNNYSPESDFVFDELELSESDAEVASLKELERELSGISEAKNDRELSTFNLEDSIDELFIDLDLQCSNSNDTNPPLTNLGEEAAEIASLLEESLESLENLELLLNQDCQEQQKNEPTDKESLSWSASPAEEEMQVPAPQNTTLSFKEETFDLSFTEGVEELALLNLPTKPVQKKDFLATVETENTSEDLFPQNTDWFAIARKSRQENRDLRKNVVNLEHSLAESQERLQSQVMRSRSADLLIAQQTEELNLSQEQINRLFSELDAAHQVNQHQQKLIENFSTELELNQQQVALLERECALLQESYNDKTQQLLQLEQQCRELRSRLLRQQRHTLQFKAALDQCLESPGYFGQIKQSLPERGKPKSHPFVSSNSLIPKVQPIPPWSSQLEAWEYPLDKDWHEDSLNQEMEEILVTISEEVTVQPATEIELPPELDRAEIVLDYIEPELEKRAAQILEQIENQEEVKIDRETIYPSANWPSPTLYPMRSAKKRREKGSIELPKFAPYQK